MKNIDMLHGNPIRSILLFSVPMLIGNIFQQLYNVVDCTVVGQFVGAEALAAVGTAGNITSLLFSLVYGLTSGSGIIIAQCFGADDREQLKDSITSIIYVAGVLSVVITTIGLLCSDGILQMLNTPDSILPQAALYMRIVFSGALPLVAYNSAAAVLRSLGDSKTPLYMLIVASVTNVVLDLVFVVKFNMGAAGVAVATVAAQTVAAVLSVFTIWRRRFALQINGFSPIAKRYMTMAIIKTGLPASLQSSMISIGGLSVQRLINSFGAMAMAAYTASGKLDSIALGIIGAIASALSVFSGQNIGAGRLDRVKKGLRSTLCVMISVCITIALIILVFKRGLICLFLDSDNAGEAIDIGCVYLSIIGIAYVIAGIMQSYQNVLRGAGDVNVSMAAGIAELSIRIFASYALADVMGLVGLWAAIPISWGAGCVIPIARYCSGKWTKKSLAHPVHRHAAGA